MGLGRVTLHLTLQLRGRRLGSLPSSSSLEACVAPAILRVSSMARITICLSTYGPVAEAIVINR